MRERYNEQLRYLNENIIAMGKLIEIAIQSAIIALMDKDTEAAKEIIKNDDEIDNKEREIETLCFKLLLEQQPMAADLRLITAALKMVTDMERIGDHASDIAEHIKHLTDFTYSNMEHIHQMSTEVIEMLHESIDAYITRDIGKAKQVISHDDIVDDLFVFVKKDLIDQIYVNKGNGEQIADYLMIAKYFERIGDHSTNIAEWVIYSLTGDLKGQEANK